MNPATPNPVNRALWFIESHFNEEISLDDIAAITGVSRYITYRELSGSPQAIR